MLAGRRRFILLVLLPFSTVFVYTTLRYWFQIRNTLSYASRPLWDKPDGPSNIIPHYDAEAVDINESICKLHGWAARPEFVKKEMWDAILFNTELDILEIRLNELNSVVDKVFIIESNRTFTGIPKPLHFAEHRYSEQFAPFMNKIVYQAVEGPSVPTKNGAPASSPWEWEAKQRDAMTQLIKTRLSNTARAPLVLFSDVDEIPTPQTLQLLKSCVFPAPLHLQMRNYMYSFEWPYGWGSWRAQVHDWNAGSTYYRHSKAGDVALADSGWHCSYCFRRIKDFVANMQGFSLADRLGGDTSLLSHARIQKVICEGRDIFNLLPEAYSYKDMFQLLSPEPSKSAVGLPRHLIENAGRFKFLLPGGCKREE